jgi:hypothetical protein
MVVGFSLIILLIFGFGIVLLPNLQPVFISLLSNHESCMFLAISIAILVGYMTTAQIGKKVYIKLFNS